MKKAKSKGPSLLKRIMLRAVAYGMIAVMLAAAVQKITYNQSDDYFYDRVVQIRGKKGGSCSGQQIKAPFSDKKYILTAGHCRGLVEDGAGVVIEESGKTHRAVFIAEDPQSDLMILKGIDSMGALELADRSKDRQEVRTFTHGAGLKTYKTEGTLIQDTEITVLIALIESPEDATKCVAQSKHEIMEVFIFQVCVMKVVETASTAFTAPGSSGGAVVDSKGKLVGVVSAGGGGYSFFVRLADIHRFLADK